MSNPDGAWLREWRIRNHYRQEDLARELDISRQTISAWEKAERLDRILELALRALESDPSLQQIGARRRPV